jgi:hypothetical protein
VAEYRFFFLYISGIVTLRYFTGEKKKYLTHWVCLVEAIRVLSMQKISQSMLNRAEVLLKLFVLLVGSLYGLEFCTLEIHMLLHIVKQGNNLTLLYFSMKK